MNKETLGMRLRRLRDSEGLTAERLSEKLGVSAGQISRWENDKERPNQTNLGLLAVFFDISVRQLTSGEHHIEGIAALRELELGDLIFKEVLVNPQWAGNPKIVPLTDYRRSSIAIRGLFSSPSPYFRFGFKLMAAGEKLFSPFSIQTEGQTMVVHIGKNLATNDLFVTVYQNAIRIDRNRSLKRYALNQNVAIVFELTKEGSVKLHVDGELKYETYFQMDGDVQIAILAWGDENQFECRFAEAKVVWL